MPNLYQWFKIYYQALLNKFSLIMYNSFQGMTFDDIGRLMNEKIETYSKLIAHIKKFSPFLTGIVLDSNISNTVNFKGDGYEMIESNSSGLFTFLQGIESYPLVFCHPKANGETKKHMRNLISLINSDFDQRVKYFYDHVNSLRIFSLN